MLVMQYASEGDLHKYLQKKFTEIRWDKKDKLRILYQISDGYLYLKYICYINKIKSIFIYY